VQRLQPNGLQGPEIHYPAFTFDRALIASALYLLAIARTTY
jgi:hypothetical protein